MFFCQKPDFGYWQVAMKATCVSCGTMAISFPTASWFTAQSSCHSIFWRHDQDFHKGGNPIQGGKASDDPRWPDSPLWRKAIPTTQANLSPHHPISVWPHCGNECQLVPVQPSHGADHHKEPKFQEPSRESRRSIKFQWPRKPRSWGPFWKPRKCQAPPKKGDSIHAWKQPAMVGDYYSQGPWCPVLAVRQKTNQRWLVHRDGARIHCSGGRTFERSIQDGFADGNQVDQECQDCTIGELFAIAVFAYEEGKVHQQPSTHQRQHALPCGILHAMLCSALFCSHCFIWHSKALDHNSHAQPWFKPSCPGSKPCVHPMHCGVNTWFAPSVGRLGGVDGSRPLPRACQQEPQAVAHLWLQERLDAFFHQVTITKGLRYPCQFKTRGSSRWNLIFPV